MKDFIQKNGIALAIAGLIVLWYGYMNWSGRVCQQCMSETKWVLNQQARHK
jgi:predicted negative regulator of RcsB-dependent stress response